MPKLRSHYPQLHHRPPSRHSLSPTSAPCPTSVRPWLSSRVKSSQAAVPQDRSGLAQGSSQESGWFPTAPVPGLRELGLQEGSSSCPCPHPPGWGDAGGFTPPAPSVGQGDTSPLLAAAGCNRLSRTGQAAELLLCRKANYCQLALIRPGWQLGGLMQQVMGFALQLEGKSLDFTHPRTTELLVSWLWMAQPSCVQKAQPCTEAAAAV